MALEKSILHSLLDAEPAAFHHTDPSARTFAVNLGFECRTTVTRQDIAGEDDAAAVKRDELKKDEAAAKALFTTFADSAGAVRFHLFSAEIDPIDPSICVLTEHKGAIAGQISDEWDAAAASHVPTWLQKAAPQPGNGHYWTVPAVAAAAAGADVATIDASRVPATYRLRAAHAWNAPVAHRLSLTHILRPDLVGTGHFVILPFFAEPTILPNSGRGQGDRWDFAYDPGGGLGEIACRTQIVDNSVAPTEAGDIGFVTPKGYLTVDPDAGNLWRVTTWFEARAASLMAPVQALSVPGSDGGADKNFDALFHWRYEHAGASPRLNAPAPAWLAATSLCASLDNIVLGIKKPVSGAASAGDILGSLAVDLSDIFESEIADRFGLADGSYNIRTLVGVLRAVFEDSNPLLQSSSDLSDPVERLRLSGQLRHVYGIAAANAERSLNHQLLDTLLSAFSETGSVPVEMAFLDAVRGQAQTLLKRALMEAEQTLQDEAGAEAVILRILETPEHLLRRPLSALFAEAYLVAIKREGDTALLAAVGTAFALAWQDYRDRLDGAFNGAEAMRRASGGEFSKALLDLAGREAALPAMPPEERSSQRLIRLVKQADYHATRLLGPTTAPAPENGLAILANAVVRPLFPADLPKRTKAVTPEDLRPFFQAAYTAALSPIEAVTDPAARFIPDSSPAPLPVQIAGNIDGTMLDAFAESYNGIAVAIRRLDRGDGTDPWAHANLAELVWPARSRTPVAKNVAPEAVVPAAIHPMLPAVSDGRGPMFIAYDGLPFAAATFRETAAAAVPEDDPTQFPFYTHHAPDLTASDFAKIPKLAYGRRFETLSFATTNAGTLPLSLQADLPWMPKADFTAPEKTAVTDPDLVSVVDYQRRTAIGQMAVKEMAKVNTTLRIGAPVAGVVPLAEDYPRTVIAAFANTPGIRDIFRDRSGGGTLAIPTDLAEPLEWRIASPIFSDQPASLAILLFNSAPMGPDDMGLVEVRVPIATVLDPSVDIRIGIRPLETGAGPVKRMLYLKYGDALQGEAMVPDVGDIEGWIRIVLTSASSAALSFAAADNLKPYEAAAPLLILAPVGDAWSDRMQGAVTVDIDTPRVGYLDFQRWFANEHSRAETFDIQAGPANQQAAANLETALLTAYVLRDTDEDLARCLDRLPDPAVCAIRIELAVEDQLVDLTSPACIFRDVSLKGKLLDVAKGLVLPAGQLWTPDLLKSRLFARLEAAFRFSLSIQPGALALSQGGTITAAVPAGLVGRLSLDALVPARYFDSFQEPGGFRHPPVLHAGLKQHAARIVAAGLVPEACFSYPSSIIRVETMLDGMHELAGPDDKTQFLKPAIRLAADMIAVRPVERARRYDLETRAGLPAGKDNLPRTRQWRLLSEIDITSQRWRPSGRPIYNHVDPAAFFDASLLSDTFDRRAPHAALPLGLAKKQGDLARFEQEAFFDRPNIDSQTVTQRLLPLPSRTLLEQHIWEAPSATYFRHRFTLRSRYAGALKKSRSRTVSSWVTDRIQRSTPAAAWTLRVAMLADLSRVLLTRPQQRALIPLTVAPRTDGLETETPPVLSILQEPPFARGGLADRIAAEIKTGFGYGFEAPHPGNTSPPLEVLDARKEIGPDPRLSYLPLNEKAALGIALHVEGPMGLTFDQPNAPAPAFPNSLLSLAPVQTNGAALSTEEHFLGVSMRRYIDPNWAMRAALPDMDALDAERCWWIDHETLREGQVLGYRIDGRQEVLLTLSIEGDGFTIWTRKAAVDGGIAGSLKQDIAVCHWSAAIGSRLAILHQPVAPGRYATSIFVQPQMAADASRGRGNGPLLLCNFEWSPPKQPVSDGDTGSNRRRQTLTLQATSFA